MSWKGPWKIIWSSWKSLICTPAVKCLSLLEQIDACSLPDVLQGGSPDNLIKKSLPGFYHLDSLEVLLYIPQKSLLEPVFCRWVLVDIKQKVFCVLLRNIAHIAKLLPLNSIFFGLNYNHSLILWTHRIYSWVPWNSFFSGHEFLK